MGEKNAQVILAVAKNGSFSRAARQLYVSPQALMKQITNIEEDIGFQIFNRTTKGVTLTASGEKLVSYLRQQQEDQQLVLEMCRTNAGAASVLRLALCGNTLHFNFSEVFRLFKDEHPDTLLHFVHCTSDQLFADLRRMRIDCFLYPRKPDEAEDIAFFPLTRTRHYCIVENSHPLASHPSVAYNDLTEYPLFAGTTNRNPHIMAKFAENNLKLQITSLAPVFVCYEKGVYISFMKMDALPLGLVQIPLECDFEDTTGIICRTPHAYPLTDFILLAQKLITG